MASDEPVDLPVINGPIDLAGLAVSLARVGGWNHGVFDRQQQYTDRQSAGQIQVPKPPPMPTPRAQ